MITFIKQKANQKGLTLVEVIIVIAIIGILSAVAIPNFLSWLPNMRLREATRELHSLIQQVRTEAIRSNQARAIVFQAANNRYSICSSSGADTDWSTLGDNTNVQTYDFTQYGNGIRYGSGNIVGNNSVTEEAIPADNVSYNNNILVFNPGGTGSGGYVYLQNKNNTVFAVGTQTSGRVLLRKWVSGSWQ